MKTVKIQDMRTDPQACPQCGKVNDASFNPRDPSSRPAEGAISVCFYCCHVAIVTGTEGALGMRVPTPEEQADLDENPTLQKVLAQLRKFHEEHPEVRNRE